MSNLQQGADSAEPDATSARARRSPLLAAAQRIEEQRAAAAASDPPSGDAALDPEAATDAQTEEAESDPDSIEFVSRSTAQIVTTVLVALGVAATVAAAYVAYRSGALIDIVWAIVMAALTIALWAARVGVRPTKVIVGAGRLIVWHRSRRSTIDLLQPGLDVEQHGTPGDRDWSFTVRRGARPTVVTGSMVEAEEFLAAVRRYRSDI